MQLTTPISIPQSAIKIMPTDKILFVGSCFAENIGRRFIDNAFLAEVNPYGVMYNPVSVLHTLEREAPPQPSPVGEGERLLSTEGASLQPGGLRRADWIVITLGTNHVYREKATGEIVDNCQKRPQSLFQEEILSVEECAAVLQKCIDLCPESNIIFTVSPIRYRKYGYHESQLSKATLLLAIEKVLAENRESRNGNRLSDIENRASETDNRKPNIENRASKTDNRESETDNRESETDNRATKIQYFPAYEIVLDELRDYRFYAPDMLHPSEQAVDYIFERFQETCFSPEAMQFYKDYQPIKQALNHKPFNPDSEEYKAFLAETQKKLTNFKKKYNLPNHKSFN